MGIENYNVEPSQGTHFFQNLTSLRVAYITVNTHLNKGKLDIDWLNQQPAQWESDKTKHIRLPHKLKISLDGKNGRCKVNYQDIDEEISNNI